MTLLNDSSSSDIVPSPDDSQGEHQRADAAAPADSPEEAEFRTWLQAAREGDTAALDSLFAEFYPVVQTMVHRRLKHDLRTTRPWLAARFSTGDVVQEVFRSVLRDLQGFAGKTKDAFAGYLAMIVRNRIIDAIRFHEADQRDGRQGSNVAALESHEAGGTDPSDALVADDEVQRFQTALATFDEREQLLIRARLDGTETFEALAEQLGYSSSYSARRAFFAAQARLVQMLSDDGSTPQ